MDGSPFVLTVAPSQVFPLRCVLFPSSTITTTIYLYLLVKYHLSITLDDSDKMDGSMLVLTVAPSQVFPSGCVFCF